MDTDKILERQLAKVGGVGGIVGSGVVGGLAGAVGAGLAAKVLPTVDYNYSLTYKGSIESATRAAYSAIVASEGYRKMIDTDESFETPVFSAILGSGAMNMNSAVVCVAIEHIDEDNTKIYISGSAKEGLIKQRTAEKAVNRIVEKLSSNMLR